MADDKKTDDGKGIPPASGQAVVPPTPSDNRLIPGGSFRAAAKPIGMSGVDHYTEPPVVKADLPDLSETPGWNMVPKTDGRA